MKPSPRYVRLANDGPLPAEEFQGGLGAELRRYDGVRVFSLRRPAQGSINSGGGNTKDVYYIEGKHDPETVIRLWLDLNSKAAEQRSDWSLHHSISDHGDDWREASYEILGPFQDKFAEREQPAGTATGTCPLCGEAFTNALANHLPECEAR